MLGTQVSPVAGVAKPAPKGPIRTGLLPLRPEAMGSSLSSSSTTGVDKGTFWARLKAAWALTGQREKPWC